MRWKHEVRDVMNDKIMHEVRDVMNDKMNA